MERVIGGDGATPCSVSFGGALSVNDVRELQRRTSTPSCLLWVHLSPCPPSTPVIPIFTSIVASVSPMMPRDSCHMTLICLT